MRESPRDVAVGSPPDRGVKEQTTLLRVTTWGDARASMHQRREDVLPQTSTCLRRCRNFFGFCPKLLYWNPVLYSLAPVLCSVTSGSLRPHGLQPTRLLCARDYPGKNTGMGCHFLLQGILRPLPLSHQGSPAAILVSFNTLLVENTGTEFQIISLLKYHGYYSAWLIKTKMTWKT